MKKINFEKHMTHMLLTLITCLIFGHQNSYCSDVPITNKDDEQRLQEVLEQSASDYKIDFDSSYLEKMSKDIGRLELSTVNFSKKEFTTNN